MYVRCVVLSTEYFCRSSLCKVNRLQNKVCFPLAPFFCFIVLRFREGGLESYVIKHSTLWPGASVFLLWLLVGGNANVIITKNSSVTLFLPFWDCSSSVGINRMFFSVWGIERKANVACLTSDNSAPLPRQCRSEWVFLHNVEGPCLLAWHMWTMRDILVTLLPK